MLVSPSLHVGGLEQVVFDLASFLPPDRFDVLVAAPDGEPFQERLREIGVPHISIVQPNPSFHGIVRSAAQLNRRVPVDRQTLIHSHNPAATLAAAIAHPRTPLIATHHGSSGSADVRRMARVYGLSRARVVGCASEVTEDLVAAGLDRSHLSTICNGIRPLHSAPAGLREQFASHDELLLVTVGRLSPEKNQTYFVQLVRALFNQGMVLRGLVVGGGAEESSLRAEIDALGLAGMVTLTGMRADARDIIAVSDLLVITSVREALPLVALEAISSGVPIAAPRVGGLRELLNASSGCIALSGELVADAGRLADGLRELAELKARCAMNGEVAERYSVHRMVDEYAALYRAVRP